MPTCQIELPTPVKKLLREINQGKAGFLLRGDIKTSTFDKARGLEFVVLKDGKVFLTNQGRAVLGQFAK